MSVRHGLLALLAEGPMHSYQLKQEFEQRTGHTWPLNIGQVSTTVQRLVRDHLVEIVPTEDLPPSSDGRTDVDRYRLTAAGTEAASAWWDTPVERTTPARDELVIKLALAVTAPGVDVLNVVQHQRRESMRSLHEYTRLQRSAEDDLVWSLVLDHLIFAAEAEVRWLDHVEAKVARASHEGRLVGHPDLAPPASGRDEETSPTSPADPHRTHGGSRR